MPGSFPAKAPRAAALPLAPTRIPASFLAGAAIPSGLMHVFPRALLIAAVAAYLLTSLPHEALVLCIGADGHVALEDSAATCCEDEAPCEAAGGLVPTGACVHRCCQCLDLPLPPSLGHLSVKVEKGRRVEQPAAGDHPLGALVVQRLCVELGNLAPARPHPRGTLAQHLHVTVLRC